jgi:hypothetical protein
MKMHRTCDITKMYSTRTAHLEAGGNINGENAEHTPIAKVASKI